ncbi:MAG: DUF1330 domain-containing protein [Candidatus Tectomicrobia bacterium]|nr:DUF1330 domain-containing protein [Candidatus Tectomicrobia bacterium]
MSAMTPESKEAGPAAGNPAYAILDIDVKDPALFEECVKGYSPTVEKYGGKFLVSAHGGKVERITGDWVPNRIVLVQWPSVEAYHRWRSSEEYRPWNQLRQKAAAPNVILVEGLPA